MSFIRTEIISDGDDDDCYVPTLYFLPNLYVKALVPNVMESGGGAFEEVFGFGRDSDGGAPRWD